MMRDLDGTPETYALDRDRETRMPYYIGAVMLVLPIVVLAVRVVLMHAVR